MSAFMLPITLVVTSWLWAIIALWRNGARRSSLTWVGCALIGLIVARIGTAMLVLGGDAGEFAEPRTGLTAALVGFIVAAFAPWSSPRLDRS